MLHLKNMKSLQNIENLNRTLEHPVTQPEKAYGLHLPNTPDSKDNVFSQNAYFSDGTEEIKIVQHDRYTPPLLHAHDFFEFFYVYEGEFVQQIGSSRFLMHTGDFCMIAPNVYHSLDVKNYSVVLNVLVTKTKFQDMVLNNLGDDNLLFGFFLENVYLGNSNNYVIFHTKGDVQIQDVVLDLCLEYVNRDKFYLQLMDALLLLLLGKLMRGYSEGCDLPKVKTKRDNQNFAILKFIDLNFRELTLSDLAEHFNYTPQHMTKRLKQIAGCSFTDYVLSKRMEAAAELLTRTNMKIKDIGENVGYFNQENFVRSFRKYYGTTPTSWRSANQTPVADSTN